MIYLTLTRKESTTVLNSVGEDGHPCLNFALGEKAFNLSLLTIMLAKRRHFIIMLVINLRKSPSILSFLTLFIMNGC